MAQIHLEVVTPHGLVVSEDVDIVTAPGIDGEFGVLANHAPFLSVIKTGTLVFKQDKREKFLMVSSGFAEVSNNKVTFLVETAEFGHEIDVDRALRARERAEKRLAEAQAHAEDLDRMRAEIALQRAVARITVAQRSSL
ncbi:F0F1 ATP synthase subunit epsilon [Desulfobulbus sp. US2]|nr:F0F1 ATP synthase subunit epsilon [Desulfobulbus sp. US4]MCW5205105.1 F0F1 ATP synthase subunit epsilon [Desulfobulbus sp. N2]MCW5207136.1 F0F1 ATP synthase subunit epsilon [Desulfobulbus sp. US2]MCW5210343.1 F0F1 ATP synthase subunit epsilon [Desulfobulbus sp. N3]MCW5214032.1 F0F1 ATP synthase subunit epsilon [Desulfobulbus sp. US5]WLE96262.1 MAG: F0F1 ATP synthase subunit epsilon [Candidatus Electrothrix communis]